MRGPKGRGRPRVGMALYGDLTYDSRVRKEARTLARAGYDVTIVCLAGESHAPDLPENVKVLVHRPTSTSVLPGAANPFFAANGGRLRSVARRIDWLRAYVSNLRSWGRAVTAACGPVDIWHVNDFTGLAAIVPMVNNVPMVYDVHDLFLETGTALRLPRPVRFLLQEYEQRSVSRMSAVITVNDGLADVLRRRYRPKRVEVIHNCPERWSPPADRPTLIRDAAEVPDDAPVVLYHGGLSADRGIEQLMEALLRPEFRAAHLVLMGYGDKRGDYLEVAGQPKWQHRLHVLDPVPPAALMPWVASADVGALLRPGSRLNDYLTTPNKLFECLAAGIPVVASDFPLLRRIIVDNPGGPLGIVCDPGRVDDIAAALRCILELDSTTAESMRSRCVAAAQTRWNWEAEAAKLAKLYDELTRGLW